MEGQCLLHAGRTDDAIVRLREAIELDPKSRIARLVAARAYIAKGMFDAAVQEAREAHTLTPSNTRARALEIVANARRGECREARAAFETLLQFSRERYVSPYNLAVACNGLDETADAIDGSNARASRTIRGWSSSTSIQSGTISEATRAFDDC